MEVGSFGMTHGGGGILRGYTELHEGCITYPSRVHELRSVVVERREVE